jgi:PAS domain S-box-containing protein
VSPTQSPTDPAARVFTEAERAAVIATHDLLGADPALDAITAFAAHLCGTPVALVSLVEEHRQVFLGRAGTALRETPRPTSFCAHAMLRDEVMIVPDATLDPRFAHTDLVTGDPHIRFYAGAPLVTSEGVPLGALCVIDGAPRAGLSALQHEGLRVLADSVMARLRDRREALGMRRELQESEGRFRTLADAMPQMVWSTRPDGFHDYYNARWYDYTGMPAGSTDGDGWNGMFHPDDQDRAHALWSHSLASGEPYEIEYRLRRHDGDYRWTLGRALPIRDEDGAIIRWFGTCTDIHDSKTASEERELVAQELRHRVKNIFAVVSGLIGLSVRARPEFRAHAGGLIDMIAALGRAHDYVHPHDGMVADDGRLSGLLDDLFAPYQGSDGRITVTGDDPRIVPAAITPLALLFHELATNAVKYGALSNDSGHVQVAIDASADPIRLVWTERGGPVVAEPEDTGFGTRLIGTSAVRQLRGTVSRQWHGHGLELALAIPRQSLVTP